MLQEVLQELGLPEDPAKEHRQGSKVVQAQRRRIIRAQGASSG